MTLHVYSARIGTSDPDALDITRRGADLARRRGAAADGEPWAPSWRILRPIIDARREAQRLMDRASRAIAQPLTAAGREDEWSLGLAAEDVEASAWAAYVEAFLGEMRRSYREYPAAWAWLLQRPRVVLLCYCTDPEHCHRAILRSRILPAIGAIDCGEFQATISARPAA